MDVIVMNEIESGCCRISDKCLIMANRTHVEVTNVYYQEIETDSYVWWENIRVELKNVEKEVSVLINDILYINMFDFVGNFS
jgi:translation elongation factor EF-1alpha